MSRAKRSAGLSRVEVLARAKLNLGLAVGPKRADGYHDIATLFQSISLADTLSITPRRRGFTLDVRLEEAALRGRTHVGGVSSIPKDGSNLVLRAAQLFARRYAIDSGAHIQLIKRIPAGAGMGGGSADAAGTLAGLAALFGVRMSRDERTALALELGSDVPFAITGGTALGLGRGERLKRMRPVLPFRALLAAPPWRISTALAYARIDRRKYALTLWRSKLRSAELLGRKQLRAEVSLHFGNTFEEVLGLRRSDWLSLRSRLIAAGATEVRMTGSGSAVFGVLGARAPATKVVGRFTGSEAVFVVRSARSGLRLETFA